MVTAGTGTRIAVRLGTRIAVGLGTRIAVEMGTRILAAGADEISMEYIGMYTTTEILYHRFYRLRNRDWKLRFARVVRVARKMHFSS